MAATLRKCQSCGSEIKSPNKCEICGYSLADHVGMLEKGKVKITLTTGSGYVDPDPYFMNEEIWLKTANGKDYSILLKEGDVIKIVADEDTEEPKKDGLNVDEFMALPDEEKVKYIVRTETGDEFDIGIFNDYEGADFVCEMCNPTEHTKFIGTSDSREPKFCFECYRGINLDSIFIKK